MAAEAPLLTVRDLIVEFSVAGHRVRAVDGVSYQVARGATLGIVGESGSGKTMSTLALLRLLPELPELNVSGEVLFAGRDLLRLQPRELRAVLGAEIGVIFQDPLTSLNPVLKVGRQITEVIEAHSAATRGEAKRRALELLELVGIAKSKMRFNQYPHELSGGMRQRVMIAIAIANRPKLLIADEPTTALDVTIQKQILDVFEKARTEVGAAAILITHDLGVIAEVADDVVVMYSGKVVESCSVDEIFNEPRHPYTTALLEARPDLRRRAGRLTPIPGRPPELGAAPSGCAFHPRCRLRADRQLCVDRTPQLRPILAGHFSACHFADELATHPLPDKPAVART